MHSGMGMPAGWEWLVIFGMCFAYLLPIAFAVFVIVYLVKIRSAVEAIRKKIDQLEQK